MKISPVARSSRSLTKLLRLAQKSNATATDSIAEKPAIKSSYAWQEPSLHLVLCCVKPISTYKENGRPKANTHKDNNEIPLRAKEGRAAELFVLQRALLFCLKVCWFTLWSPAIKMRIAFRLRFCRSACVGIQAGGCGIMPPLNQRTICRRDCHEREKIICIHAHGL